MRTLVPWLAVVVAGAACASTPASAPTPPPRPSADAPYLGAWASPACGARAYERVVRFGADGRYVTEDRFVDAPHVVLLRGKHRFVATGTGICQRDATRPHDCIVLEGDARAAPEARAIPQYPAVLFFDAVPYEADGAGRVCSYHRVETTR